MALRPRDSHARFLRGLACDLAGELAGARADCDAALALDPRSADTHANRGQMLAEAGRLPEAIARDPGHYRALENRAHARARLGDLAGAVADSERALAVGPAGWPHRAEAETALATARRALDGR